jgi:predicted ATP-dependent endonuclease of OLD family
MNSKAKVQYALDALSHIYEITEFDNVKVERGSDRWDNTSMLHVTENTAEYYIGLAIINFLDKRISILSSANVQREIDLMQSISTTIDKKTREYVKFLDLLKEMIELPNIEINRQKPLSLVYNEEDDLLNKYSMLEFHESNLTRRLPFYSLSYGSKQLLHQLILIETADTGDVICIEEPENHLHSNVQKKLFERIVEKCKCKRDTQFFITTHSRLFTALSNDLVKTYLITRSDAISRVTLVEKESQLKLIKQHLGVENSDIYLSQYVIFVEGHTEEIAIQMVGKAMGYDEIGKEIRIIDFGGKDRIRRLTEFLKYIHYFDTEAIILADGHPDLKKHITELKRVLSFYDKTRDYGISFEDLFDNKMILKAMKNLAQKMSFTFEMDEQTLAENRKRDNIAKIIQDYLNVNAGRDLDKTLLAKELCSIIVKEINEIGTERTRTKFEDEINGIMAIIKENKKY